MHSHIKITIVTVTYGSRFSYVSKLVEAAHKDAHVSKIIIVSNGSHDIEKIEALRSEHGDLMQVISLPKNVGSVKAFKLGLQESENTACDFVLLLDDDNVPEENFAEMYLNQLDMFTNPGEREKVILLGNRHLLPGNQSFFTNKPFSDHSYSKTFYSVFSLKKVKHFVNILLHRKDSSLTHNPFFPMTPAETFAYGGTLLPIEAVRSTPFPDERLVLYCDDTVYSWNMKNAGYEIYVCSRPFIDDLEISLDDEYHFIAFFKKETAEFKVFFKLRNSAFLSLEYNPNNRLWILLNIYAWVVGLFLIALIKLPWNALLRSRMKLVFGAIRNGIKGDFTIPEDLHIPEGISLDVDQG
jgi:GT2 family glycosyltransferase